MISEIKFIRVVYFFQYLIITNIKRFGQVKKYIYMIITLSISTITLSITFNVALVSSSLPYTSNAVYQDTRSRLYEQQNPYPTYMVDGKGPSTPSLCSGQFRARLKLIFWQRFLFAKIGQKLGRYMYVRIQSIVLIIPPTLSIITYSPSVRGPH